MENSSWLRAAAALGIVLLEKAKSCFWRTILAASSDETTTVVMLPSLSDITGPYFLDSLASDWWGLDPRWRMLPMIGNGYGPGGSLANFRALRFDVRSRVHIHAMKNRSGTVRKSMKLFGLRRLLFWDLGFSS
ncbi:UNVERIFIED_CONTAM: hypothetical protein Sradi_1124700 [Sesamum radiatum]|uniref:Uncharacterized protein n=1 Tax=Sesamum radiatum TaxID=300843 RepID=A0AAW2V8T3_SESRA